MKYGLIMPGRGILATPENLGLIARKAEELGYDALLAGDHIVVPRKIASHYPYTERGEFPGALSSVQDAEFSEIPPGEYLEQLTVLSFLAGQTRTIRLVTSVLIVPHRNPLVAAKALATLDVLSQGRLVVGVGVGWMREEFEALGLPHFEKRGAVTDEYIRAFKELWTSDNPRFEGKYCRFDNVSFLPKPVQKPHPPIWVGGESRPALRRTAELADGWFPLGSNATYPMGTPEQITAGLEQLNVYARRFGRDPSEIEVIHWIPQFQLKSNREQGSCGIKRLPFMGTPDQIASDIRQYQQLGVGTLILDFLSGSKDIGQVVEEMENFATQVWPKVWA